MNDPASYYDPQTNTYDFSRWCDDHAIDPLMLFAGEAYTPALAIAAKMSDHNHREQRWQEAQHIAIVPQTRPLPFVLALLVMLAGLLATVAPLAVIAALWSRPSPNPEFSDSTTCAGEGV